MNKKETGRSLSLFYGVGGLRWYTTECLRGVALIRPGFAGPPSPQGKALSTQYNFVEWYHPKKPSPRGKVAAKQTDEGHLPIGIGCVGRQHRALRNHEFDPPAKPDTIRYLRCAPP